MGYYYAYIISVYTNVLFNREATRLQNMNINDIQVNIYRT